jgi:hypothetical protein
VKLVLAADIFDSVFNSSVDLGIREDWAQIVSFETKVEMELVGRFEVPEGRAEWHGCSPMVIKSSLKLKLHAAEADGLSL